MGSSSKFIVIIAICLLVLQTIYASPQSDELCKSVYCGKGSCKASSDYSYNCECQPGWKRTRFDEGENMPYLPCIVMRDCLLDNTCNNAQPPPPPTQHQQITTAPPPPTQHQQITNAPPPAAPENKEHNDLCTFAYCGKGSCKVSTNAVFICECKSGWRRTPFDGGEYIPYLPCVIPVSP